MKKAGNAHSGFPLFAILCASLLLASCAKVETVKEPEIPTVVTGRYQGTLERSGIDVPLAGTEVRAGQARTLATAEGRFGFATLPPGKTYFVAEKRFDAGPVRRVLGMEVMLVGRTPAPIYITMRDATDLDAFCERCHPYKNKVSRDDQIVRCLHGSGMVPSKATAGKAKLDGRGRVTCESCHTLHDPASERHFLVAPLKGSLICHLCHG